MANDAPRRGSLFSGLVLILFGVLFLLHNYRSSFPIVHILTHWWPLLLILWGLAKLYERTVAQRAGATRGLVISAGEIFLVLGLLTLVGIVALADFIPTKVEEPDILTGTESAYDLDVAPRAVPANARIAIRNGRGDITVRASDAAEIRVSGKKRVHAWSESEAQRTAESAKPQIVENGDSFEIRTPDFDSAFSRVAVDLDVVVPKKSTLSIRNERGNIEVSDAGPELSISAQRGDVEVRGAAADVDVKMHRGDVKVSDTKGDVKISGKGGEVEVVNAAGGLTIEGEFYGPIRAEKVAKGVRFLSSRTDLTLTQLSGQLETGSGNLEIFDSTGNLTLRTREYDISLENVGGKMKVENRGGAIQVRFVSPPREEVEITNSSAGITLNLPASSNFQIVADSRSGDISSEFDESSLKKITTQSGDSHFEGSVGVRGPKIILKTSYGSISLRKGS